MENIEQIKNRINIEKFLFLWKEPVLHTRAFLGRATLKAGVLICSIIDLLLATGIALHCIEKYSFLFFLGFFLPSLAVIGGSVLLLLSMEHMEEKKAYWGYIVIAISLWLHALFVGLSFIFTFLYSPKYFFSNLIGSLLMIITLFGIYGYSAWIDYCFTKHLGMGNREIVESGRAEGLISKEQGPGVVPQPQPDATGARQEINVSDIERR